MERFTRHPEVARVCGLTGGALLLMSLFLPWYDADFSVTSRGRVEGAVLSGDTNAWAMLPGADVLIAAIALAVLAAAIFLRTRVEAEIALTAAAVCAVLLVGYHLIEPPALPEAQQVALVGTGGDATAENVLKPRGGPYFALSATFLIASAALSARATSPFAPARETVPPAKPAAEVAGAA